MDLAHRKFATQLFHLATTEFDSLSTLHCCTLDLHLLFLLSIHKVVFVVLTLFSRAQGLALIRPERRLLNLHEAKLVG